MCERSELSTRGRFWVIEGLTARKTSRCNLAIEIIFVPSSQSTFNFSVLRGAHVDFCFLTY